MDSKNREKSSIHSSQTMFLTTNHRSFSAQCEKSSLPMCYLEESPHARATKFGSYRIWVVKDEVTKSLQPVMLPPTKLPAPDYILKLVCCSYSSAQPCHSSESGCVAANLACTTFCHCQGGSICNNEQTRATEEVDEEEEHLKTGFYYCNE